jgi:hypothetical protein
LAFGLQSSHNFPVHLGRSHDDNRAIHPPQIDEQVQGNQDCNRNQKSALGEPHTNIQKSKRFNKKRNFNYFYLLAMLALIEY